MQDSLPPVATGRRLVESIRANRRRAVTVAMLLFATVLVGYFAVQPRPSASPPGASRASNANPSIASNRPSDLLSSGAPGSSRYQPTVSSSNVVHLIVHVAGAVVRPGVVTVLGDARVIDAIDAAGGPRRDADVDQIDLAAKVIDGTRIYVPKRGESVAPNPESGAGPPSASDVANSQGPVNLNTASQVELETLPGIGPSLAQAIIAERAQLGGFHSVDDLKRVHGIGDRRFEQLKTLVDV